MASEWFMRKNGEEDGPFSSQQLREMARNGLLAATDLVWKEGMADWRPAGESRRLFPRPKKGSRNKTSLDVRPDQAAAAPGVNSWLPQIPVPRDWRIRVGLVAGGATLLAVSVLGVVFRASSGELRRADRDGRESGAMAAVPNQAEPIQPPQEKPKADVVVPSAPPIELPPGMTKLAEYRLSNNPDLRNVFQVTALAISPDNRYLAIGRGDGRLVVFDTVSGAAPLHTERAHPGGDRASPLNDFTTSISFSPSGNRVGWGTMYRHFSIANLKDGSLAWRSPVMARGSRTDLDLPQVLLKDDETLLVATSSGVAELSTIDVCRPLNGGTPWQRLGVNGVIGDNQMTFIAKSGQGITARGAGRWSQRKNGSARLVALCPDGKTGGTLVTEQAGSSLMLFTLGGEGFAIRKNLPPIVVRDARFIVPAREMAVLVTQSQLLGIDGESGGYVADLGPASPPTMLDVDAEHRQVVVCRADGDICLLTVSGKGDQKEAALSLRFRADSHGIARAAISSDGTRVAVSQPGSVILIGIDANRPVDEEAKASQ